MSSRAHVGLLVLLVLAHAVGGCGRDLSPTAPAGHAGAGAQDGAAGLVVSEEGAPEPGAPEPAESPDPIATAPSNVSPVVTITSPQPNPLFTPVVPPSFTVRWEGTDADGPGPGIKSYRYLLIHEGDPDFLPALVQPDSLRRKYAPRFEGWTQVSGRVESAALEGLTPNDRYVFVITAFDRHHDYDPVFSLSKNMLFFIVSFASAAE